MFKNESVWIKRFKESTIKKRYSESLKSRTVKPLKLIDWFISIIFHANIQKQPLLKSSVVVKSYSLNTQSTCSQSMTSLTSFILLYLLTLSHNHQGCSLFCSQFLRFSLTFSNLFSFLLRFNSSTSLTLSAWYNYLLLSIYLLAYFVEEFQLLKMQVQSY